MTIAAMKKAFKNAYGHEPTEDSFLWGGFKEGYAAAIAEQEKCEPVAWLHSTQGRCDVIHKDVKDLLKRYADSNKAIHRPMDKGELYTIPLFTHPAPVPAGWQLVPVEPTKEMVGNEYNREMLATIWKSMLAAAPKPGEMK